MLDFHAADWFETGRGRAAVVTDDIGDPRNLLGEHVMIDGIEYEVRGVETFCIPDPSGFPFSLLV